MSLPQMSLQNSKAMMTFRLTKEVTGMKYQSDNQLILQYMKEHGSITRLEAEIYIGCRALPQRIHELRNHGIPIASETVKVPKRGGRSAYVSRYSLMVEDDE